VTAVAAAPAFIPVRELPNGKNFYSPRGLYQFQAEDVAKAYLRTEEGSQQGQLVGWNTGLGKTIFGMALASLLIEDGRIDQVIVAAEKNKIVDWREEFERFTTLSAAVYHGQGRQKRLTKNGIPHVLVSTYDTLRTDLVNQVEIEGRKSKKIVDGPLMEALGLRGKRVLWILDEVTALRSRGSQRHKAFEYVLKELRKTTHQRAVGLTATPVERDIEDSYNVGRILTPARMMTVASFEEQFTRGRDLYGHYIYQAHAAERFADTFRPICLIKHKTDEDVRAQFPKQVEKSLWVPLEPAHKKLYTAINEMIFPEGEEVPQSIADLAFTVQRMTAGHPASHLYAGNKISQTIVDIVGAQTLCEMPSSKSIDLISRLTPIVKGQGAQAIVFSFFGRSVLRALGDDLRKAGFAVVEYHGGRSLEENERSKNTFVTGQAEILLASDAASQGLNLQNAQYVFEYESALSFARRTQRINRAHRIGSVHDLVTCYTMIAEGTVEEGIIRKMIKRNQAHDDLVGGDSDDGYVTAADRREFLGIGQRG
jgi:SNF2 family DNA or RNA helicase